MSRNPTWKQDTKGAEHPARETLLACIREQCPEQEKNRINDHLLSGCAPCNLLHNDLKQSSFELDCLKHISRHLYYPELQSNQVLDHIQRGEPLTSAWTGKRKRKFQARRNPVSRPQVTGRYERKVGLRFISIPAAFAMLILLTAIIVTLVYALTSMGRGSIRINLPNSNLHNDAGQGDTSIKTHQSLPTATASVAVTITPTTNVRAEATLTPTATAVKGPTIDFCPPPGDNWNQYIFICGYNFNAGDNVSLVLDIYGRNEPVVKGPYQVNEYGVFTGWYRYSCQNPPLAIYARDDSSSPATVVSNTLTNIPLPACSEPTPTATHGDH
jgi:hypothetical protein